MKEEYQDRVDNYLLKRMTSDERAAFEQEMAQDEDLRNQVEFTKVVQTALKSRNEKLAAIKEWEGEYLRKEKRIMVHPVGRKTLYWISGIAAMFIVGFFLFQKPTIHDNDLDTLPSVVRGLREGKVYFDIESNLIKKNYVKALGEIADEFLQLEHEMDEINQNSSMPEERKAYKKKVIEMRQEDLKWLKVQALWGLNRQHDALPLINELRKSEGVYQVYADSLYEVLRK